MLQNLSAIAREKLNGDDETHAQLQLPILERLLNRIGQAKLTLADLEKNARDYIKGHKEDPFGKHRMYTVFYKETANGAWKVYYRPFKFDEKELAETAANAEKTKNNWHRTKVVLTTPVQ